MSNIAYITTKKHIKSYDMMTLLQKINERRFEGRLTIVQGYEDGPEKQDSSVQAWKISHEDCWDYLWIRQDSARKLACKWPHDPWMSYVHVVFQEELGKLTKGVLSDEGVDERWKPKPHKYPSYVAWVELIYSRTKDKYPAYYQELFDVEMSHAPKGMEKY